MELSELRRIKTKIQSINPQRWWGDDFDVRFYLISRLKEFNGLKILDVGGGVGIISSEMNSSNFRVNMDVNMKDLVMCLKNNGHDIHNVCGTSDYMPFRSMSFDMVICSHLMDVLKERDLKKGLESNDVPSNKKLIKEIYRVMKRSGDLFLTAPNNAYYNTTKTTVSDLKETILPYFPDAKIFFYNTHHKLNKKNRKLNMANVIPKLIGKFIDPNKVMSGLLKETSTNDYSVSFFVEAKHNN